MKKVLLVLVIGLSLMSCTTQRTATSKVLDIYGSGVIQYPVVAEMDVQNNKITGTASSRTGASMEAVKNAAVVDAIKKANADVLIEPVFETESDGSTIRATVTGFPGRYTNFRTATVDDVPLLDMGVLQKANVYEPEESVRGKTKLWPIIALFGVIGVVAVLAGFGI